MFDDQQLLRRYLADGSEAAFGELVARYVNLVYSTALRRTGGDAHLAQDAAQLVFTDLARKVRSLPENVVLAGWLHRATQFAAAQLLRTDRRRMAREQEAVAMNALTPETTPDWNQIRPLLDLALDELGDDDRDAVILRFFEQRSLA
jgi:RNA polymerase sigma factor (sigma-70 family)